MGTGKELGSEIIHKDYIQAVHLTPSYKCVLRKDLQQNFVGVGHVAALILLFRLRLLLTPYPALNYVY